MTKDILYLKWGTFKGSDLISESSKTALNDYFNAGHNSASAMLQKDTTAQKEALYRLIDTIDGEIINDWSGETLTKEEAKDYVKNYGMDSGT